MFRSGLLLRLANSVVLALASLCLVFAPLLRAQDTTAIHDPAESNAYKYASTQSDPKAKAAALESFLLAYPQSSVKSAALDSLIDIYYDLEESDNTLSAALRLLEVNPDHMKAIFVSVSILKNQCVKTVDAQICDKAAALAQKGLLVPRQAPYTDEELKRITDAAYPLFHSAIDLKADHSESRTGLMRTPFDHFDSALSSGDHFGFQVRPVIQNDMVRLALTKEQGIFVVSVEKGSMADITGILAGDVILQVNGADVGDMQHLSQLIHSGAIKTFIVRRKGKKLLLTVPQSM